MKKTTVIIFALLLLAAFLAGPVSRAYDDLNAALSDKSDSLKNTSNIENWEELLERAPDVDTDSWKLKLVNFENYIPDDFFVPTAVSADEYLFDERAVNALDELLSAGRNAGMQLVLTSAYRSHSYQDGLFQNKVSLILSENGISRSEAENEAARVVARPGSSEHNLGLAADIVCESYNILDEGYSDTAEARWLRENCADFGFILRYDKDKEDITRVIFEPWHFRFVGTDSARFMMEEGLCLEEFLTLYK